MSLSLGRVEGGTVTLGGGGGGGGAIVEVFFLPVRARTVGGFY